MTQKPHPGEGICQALFEHSRDAIMTLEPPSWRFTSGNPAAVRLFGAKHEEDFIAHSPWELWPERQSDGQASAAKAREMVRTAMRDGSHFFNWTHRRIGGEEFEAEVLFTRTEQGPRAFVVAIVRDITERTRMVREISAFNTRLKQLVLERTAEVNKLSRAVEESPIVVVITDHAGTIEYVNPMFVQVTGYTASEAMGQSPSILKSGAHPPEFYRSMWQTLLSGKPWRGEICNRRKDGGLYWESANIFPLRNPEGIIGHFVAVKEDITERKQVAAALSEQNIRLKAALEEAREAKTLLLRNDRLATLGRMSAGLIHEINNPLNYAAQGICLLELISAEVPEARRREFMDTLQDVKEGIARVARIVSDLRGFTPCMGNLSRTVDVRTEIDRTLRFFAHELNHNAGLRVDVDVPKGLTVFGVPNHIVQILVNLVQNALDAMRAKPYQAGVSPALSITATSVNQGVHLKVADNGPGIPPEIIDTVFDPFFSTKEIGQGVGLGLTICHRIMSEHGGLIEVHSKPGIGCEFVLVFPAASADLPGPRTDW